jgi:hypothetical protein
MVWSSDKTNQRQRNNRNKREDKNWKTAANTSANNHELRELISTRSLIQSWVNARLKKKRVLKYDEETTVGDQNVFTYSYRTF